MCQALFLDANDLFIAVSDLRAQSMSVIRNPQTLTHHSDCYYLLFYKGNRVTILHSI